MNRPKRWLVAAGLAVTGLVGHIGSWVSEPPGDAGWLAMSVAAIVLMKLTEDEL